MWFPHFSDLPPATPAQAAFVYALLHVSPRIVKFDRILSGLAVFASLYELFLLWLLLKLRIGVRFAAIAKSAAPNSLFFQGAQVYALISLSLFAANLPLSSIRGWWMESQYGLSNQNYWQWLWDHSKAVGVNLLVGALIVGLLLVIIQRSPKRWPLLFAAALAPIIAFGIFLEPLVVDPLFNKFTPLPVSSPVYAPIKALATRAGIGDAAILIADKSKETKETNAYVDGIGSSARIVLWDTILQQMPPNEIVAITGHEMGHYVEHHLVIGFALTVAGLFIIFPLIRLTALAWIRRWGKFCGISSLSEPAALPILLLVLQLALMIVQPISNQVSRWIEHRADAYSLGMVRDRVSLAKSFIDLSKQNLEDPYPPTWEKFWFDDHPPIGERVNYALFGQPDE